MDRVRAAPESRYFLPDRRGKRAAPSCTGRPPVGKSGLLRPTTAYSTCRVHARKEGKKNKKKRVKVK